MIHGYSSSQPRPKLSAGLQRIYDDMEQNIFGKLLNVQIKNGEPVYTPETRLVREVKFASPHHESHRGIASAQFQAMIQEFRKIGNGLIEFLEFKNGLPFRMLVAAKLR